MKMRRRKSNRGRPRKAKSDNNNVQKDVSSAFNCEADDSSEIDAPKNFIFNEKDYDAKLNKIGPTTYRIGSTQLDMENAGDDLKPIFRDNDILFQVECGSNKAQMYLSKLCQGSKGSCIQYDGSWLTPNEFQYVSGRETAKDWKRSIRHFGRSLKLLLTKGILAVHPTACRCDSCCFLTSSDEKPSLIVKQALKKSKNKSKSKGRSRRLKNAKENNKVQKCEKNSKDNKDSTENSKTETTEEDEYQDSTEDGSADEESENENGEASESGAASDSGGDDGEETEEENGNDRNNSGNEGKEAAATSSTSGGSSESESSSDSSDTEPNNDGEGKAGDNNNIDLQEKDEEEDDEEEDMDTTESSIDDAKQPKELPVCGIPKETEDVEMSDASKTDKIENDVTDTVTSDKVDNEKDLTDSDKCEKSATNSPKSDPTTISVTDSKVTETMFTAKMSNPSEDQGCSTLMDKIAETIEHEIEKDDIIRCTTNDPQQNSSKPASPIKFSTPSPIKFNIEDIKTDDRDDDSSKGDNNVVDSVENKDCLESVSTDVKDDTVVEKLDQEAKAEVEEKPIIPSVNSVKSDSIIGGVANVPGSPAERVVTPASTPPASPARRCVDRVNSSQGKSRLSSIIDILRTSKERQCQKPATEPEPKVPTEKSRPPPPREPAVDPPSVPKPREKPDPLKTKPLTAEDVISKDRPHNAFRYPASLLPFGYPSPEHLEKVSREAHDQLSKYHRQFEKNLESMIAQNMNPFIPELSIYSLPEHRAQMELHYMQTMEQLARQQYAMAENRSRQMIHENNLLIGKLHDRISRGGSSHPSHAAVSQHNNIVNSKHSVEKKGASGSDKRTSAHHNQQHHHHHREQTTSHSQSQPPAKALPAHRHVPDTRPLDKHSQPKLQTPPAAHGHHITSHPSSIGAKASSSSSSSHLSPFIASSTAATHPRAESVPAPSSSPLAGTLLPQQMWSSCFPFVVPPPSLEMTRLTQFFPNLSSSARTSKESVKHPASTPPSALDLSTKKQKTSRNSDVHCRSTSLGGGDPAALAVKSQQTQLANSGSSSQALRRSLQEGKSTSFAGLDYERKNGVSGCSCGLKHVDDIRTWSVKDVCHFVKRLDSCSMYSEIFLRYRVDGQSLPLLTTDHLTKSFGMKLGSALILTGAIARKLQDISQIVPCDFCKKRLNRE